MPPIKILSKKTFIFYHDQAYEQTKISNAQRERISFLNLLSQILEEANFQKTTNFEASLVKLSVIPLKMFRADDLKHFLKSFRQKFLLLFLILQPKKKIWRQTFWSFYPKTSRRLQTYQLQFFKLVNWPMIGCESECRLLIKTGVRFDRWNQKNTKEQVNIEIFDFYLLTGIAKA